MSVKGRGLEKKKKNHNCNCKIWNFAITNLKDTSLKTATACSKSCHSETNPQSRNYR
jgi:hypothetical protein